VRPGTIAVLWVSFQAGENLAVLEQRFETFELKPTLELNQDKGQEWLKPAYQCIRNLQSQDARPWRQLTFLSGAVMKENEFIAPSASAGSSQSTSLVCPALDIQAAAGLSLWLHRSSGRNVREP
jgi:hypothetical protein